MSNFNVKAARFSVTGLTYSTEHGCWMASITPPYSGHTRAFLRAEDRSRAARGPILRKLELEDACRFVDATVPSTASEMASLLVREATAGRLLDNPAEPEPEPEPTPEPPAPVPAPVAVDDKRLAALESEVEHLTDLVAELEANTPKTLQVQVAEREPVDVDGLVHESFKDVLTVLIAGLLAYLVGPAGTGKTSLGRCVAKALDLPCHVASMHEMMTAEDLVGFLSPTTGDPVRSADAEALRRFFGEGGVYVQDELDNGNANTVAALNNLVLADEYHFPGDDEPTKRHPDFYLIASANTYGTGPTAEYVGRNALDAASLNRYVQIEVGYDHNIERTLTGAHLTGHRLDTYLEFCWQARKQIADERVIFGTRNIVEGAQLLAAGLPWEKVLRMRLLPGVNEDLIRKSGLSVAPAGF